MNLVFGSTIVSFAPIATDRPRREAEREAIAMLVQQMLPGAKMCHRPDGAPYIDGSDVHVSVSHSRHVAALAVDSCRRIGIDIEESRPEQLRRVAHRFLSDDEYNIYGLTEAGLLRAWTIKEALIKASGRRDADLRGELILPAREQSRKAQQTATVIGSNGKRTPYNILFTDTVTVGTHHLTLTVVAPA